MDRDAPTASLAAALSLGRCEASKLPRDWNRAVRSDGGWKAVLLMQVALRGLQSVREECCDGYDFAPLLYRKVWGGSIGAVQPGDRWPAGHGVQSSFGDVPAERLAAGISACGVAAASAPVVSALAAPGCVAHLEAVRANASVIRLKSRSGDPCATSRRPKLCRYQMKKGPLASHS